MQDAVGKLVQTIKGGAFSSKEGQSATLPLWEKASAVLNPWSKGSNPSNAVHPTPAWRRTASCSDLGGEEDDREPPSELVAAAMCLLQDPTLAEVDVDPRGEQGGLPKPPRDWEDFVQHQLETKASVAASSRLLAMRNAVPSPSARMVFASQVSCWTG